MLLGELELGQLNLTSQEDYILDEAADHIQENLEDELVQEALRKVSREREGAGSEVAMVMLQGVDLRQYSREIEAELRKVEVRSIQDCIRYCVM